jgi:A/G-specific adenine glycosylase
MHWKAKKAFQEKVWSYYRQHRRDFSWRNGVTPYRVLVSEIMLQQTQASRVEAYFMLFMHTFPSLSSLARAPLSAVLKVWQGMGYNRRAKYLHECVRRIVDEYKGRVPCNPVVLETFPGIGKATARSIVAFGFDAPVVFVETNIRRVILHHFFPQQHNVSDEAVMEVAEQVLDTASPREWYNALMDYGTMLAKREGNANRRSRVYKKQPAFAGSLREVRGALIRALTDTPYITKAALLKALPFDAERIKSALDQLEREGLVVYTKRKYHFPQS